MFRYGFTSILLLFVICSFCGGEFKSLGRHAWRCKEKLRSNGNGEPSFRSYSDALATSIATACENSKSVSNCSEIKCCCGKLCNGLRGLKMHQRSCRVIKDLEEETFESHDSPDNYDDTGQPDYEIDLTSIPSIKPGIRLPHSDQDWKIANDYFVAAMPISEVNNKPINIVLSQMNSIIYDYFFNTFGPIENSHSSHFVDKYKDYSKNLC